MKPKRKTFELIHQGKCKHLSLHFTHTIIPIHSGSPTITTAPYDMLDEEHKHRIDKMAEKGLYAQCNH